MNNLSNSFKKFVSNKITVAILGLVLCCLIIWFGFNYQVNQMVALTSIPTANKTIQPRTKITASMIKTRNLPKSFLVGTYFENVDDIIGKYSNYNTVIPEGSLFYMDSVIDESRLPNSSFGKVEEGYTVINYAVNMSSTYANSMMPNDLINIYFKGKNDNGTVMFGKFLSNIKILDVKDANGQHVFENSEEARIPAYMMFALPEDMHLLFRKAVYLSDSYNVELMLVPNTAKLEKGDDAVMVSSKDIQDFINNKTKMVSVDEILSSTDDVVNNESTTKKKTNSTNTVTNENSKKNNE